MHKGGFIWRPAVTQDFSRRFPKSGFSSTCVCGGNGMISAVDSMSPSCVIGMWEPFHEGLDHIPMHKGFIRQHKGSKYS